MLNLITATVARVHTYPVRGIQAERERDCLGGKRWESGVRKLELECGFWEWEVAAVR